MIQPRCRKQYFNNQLSTLPLLDAIFGAIDEEAQTITIFMPYPFQLLGFAEEEYWNPEPPTEGGTPRAWVYNPTTDQHTYRELILTLFNLMMYANRDVGNYSESPFLGAITYQEEDFAKFDNYFMSYLNPDLKPLWFNQFIANAGLIRKFWEDQLVIADPETVYPSLLELCTKMFNTSDRRLWGAPGLYTIYYGDSTPGGFEVLEFEVSSDCPIE